MDPITGAILKEAAMQAAEKTVEKSAEMAIDYTADKIDDVTRLDKESNALRNCEKITKAIEAGTLSDAAIETRVEASAHSACRFFGIPDAELTEGGAIGVYRKCDIFIGDDVFEYNLDQFKDMNCVSFEDMTKVWAHECGHRILRMDFQEPWAQELGADFFSGVRSEMLGLPSSNFEEMLASTKASPSHPDGIIRVKAIEYGREVVRQLQVQGITPTIENCKAAFANSTFAQVSHESLQGEGKLAAFVDDKAWHEKNAKSAQENANYYTKEAAKAAEKGDFSHAKELEQTAQSYQRKANDELNSASSCTKLVDIECATETVEQVSTNSYYCPIEGNNGSWTGLRGNSDWVPYPDTIPSKNNLGQKNWLAISKEYDCDRIRFNNGSPDFSVISKGEVMLDEREVDRSVVFNEADIKLAEIKGCTPSEVRAWRKENGYTWHEKEDGLSVQKVPSIIHGNIPHIGGHSVNSKI